WSGKAIFWARPYLPPTEIPDDEFPLVLNTGRLQHQWHTLTKTGKISTLNKLNPSPFVELHPNDAERLGIRAKDCVEIRSRRGSAILPALVTDRVLPGNCFAPIHWNDVYGSQLAINAVTSDAVDPISLQPQMKFCAVAVKKVELIAREFSFDRGSSDAKEKSVPACDEYAESAMAFAPPSEETSMTLIKTLAQKIGVTQVVAPEFSTSERDYLSGYISGLQASAKLINAVPTIPLDAPIDATHRTWINGLLAGMFSRTSTIGMPTQNSTPKLNLLW